MEAMGTVPSVYSAFEDTFRMWIVFFCVSCPLHPSKQTVRDPCHMVAGFEPHDYFTNDIMGI